ncbi:4'-phosphopantetheinyl transferase family protein [Tenacibaculum sp. 190524A02b]|uniref:4'-phosphopantetheinyl transferase family protein n=1 Tax=Tenacibaculum vairaonense TaxID=3137860 RepID=UPI0031FB05CC
MCNIIYVQYVHNCKPLTKKLWDKGLQLIPKEFHTSINKFRFWNDRQASLLGKLLLQKAFKNLSINKSLNDIQYTKYNKPYIEDTISFNISHSGEYVVCAYVKEKNALGIDVEKINKEINIDDFSTVLNSSEKSNIVKSTSPFDEFYKIWTIKESVCKADGRGLNFPLQTIKIHSDCIHQETKRWYYKNIDIHNDYKCHLVTSEKDFTLDISMLTNKELFEM